jgi:hypothetical protein
MVNKQRRQGNDETEMNEMRGNDILNAYAAASFFIDLFPSFVYYEVDSIDFKMKRMRFPDIYLIKQDEEIIRYKPF